MISFATLVIMSGDRIENGNFLTRHVTDTTDLYQVTTVITGNHRIDRDALQYHFTSRTYVAPSISDPT